MMKLLSASLPPIKARPKRTGMQKNKESPAKARCCMLSWLGMDSDQFDRWAGDQDVGYATILFRALNDSCCGAVCIDLFFVSLLLVGGQSWAPDRTIWRPNPSSSHPMPAPKPLPHLFFPPNTHHHSSTS